MTVIHDVLLLATVASLAWIALDVGLDPTRRRRLQCVVALALAALAWSAGELLLRHAQSPAEILGIRRLLFAGVCALPAAWVWTAVIALRPDALRTGRRLFLALLVPGAIAYACLYLAPGGLFLDWYAVPPRRGPLFFAHAAYSWLLIAAGAVLVLRAMMRSPGRSPLRIGLVLATAFVPVLANAAYLLLHATPWDPTPVAIGLSAFGFRFFVMDLAWGAHHPAFARAEVVAQMRTGVLVADLTGRIVDWNQAAARILRSEQLATRPLHRLLAEAGESRAREIEVSEFPLVRRGQVVGTGAVVADRTALRRAELRLEMTTRVEALGYLAAGVAHEINNPLSYVSVNLTLLDRLMAALDAEGQKQTLPAAVRVLTAESQALLADAREGTERIQRIVERMTQAASLDVPDRESARLDVRDAVEKAVARARFGKRESEVRCHIAAGLPEVVAAETDVIHILLHLLLNAMQIGGAEVPISIEARAEDEGVAVRVEDEGPGIAPADLPHVFEPLFTTRRPGPALGLGLSLCWDLARRNAGRLEAASRPGGGAVFTLWLPAA